MLTADPLATLAFRTTSSDFQEVTTAALNDPTICACCGTRKKLHADQHFDAALWHLAAKCLCGAEHTLLPWPWLRQRTATAEDLEALGFTVAVGGGA
jgi:hypothetical protein